MLINHPMQVAPCERTSGLGYPSDIEEIFGKINEHEVASITLLDNRDCDGNGKPIRSKRSERKRRKAGGWRITTGMRIKEAFEIKEGIHYLQRAGKPLTAFITLRPPSEFFSDRKRQDWCRRKAYNIRRKLTRHGLEYIALAVFEKPTGGQLHLHLLLHVLDCDFYLLKAIECRPLIDVRQSHKRHYTYVLKNRLPIHPDFEKELRKILPRKSAAPFRGKRWSFSKDAQKYIDIGGALRSNTNG